MMQVPRNGLLLNGPMLSFWKIKPYPIARSASKQNFSVLEGTAPCGRARALLGGMGMNSSAFKRRRQEWFQTCEATATFCSLSSSLGDASSDQEHQYQELRYGTSRSKRVRHRRHTLQFQFQIGHYKGLFTCTELGGPPSTCEMFQEPKTRVDANQFVGLEATKDFSLGWQKLSLSTWALKSP